MIRRIVLENFMSHKHTVIDLADGLTVLTGPNNCGKSAVVAALQILATNGRTTHVMRHGAKECRVTVETDDGHRVVWERKKSVVKYTINGEDVHRVGASVPQSLHEVLRLDRVSAETGASKTEYDIHFGEQKSPVFLLNESGGRAASFFASSSDASRLVEMQHLHKTNVRDQKSEANRLKGESEKVEARLKHYESIGWVEESLVRAESMRQEIELAQSTAKRMRETIDLLGQRCREVRQLHRLRTSLARLDSTPTNPVALEHAQRTQEKLATLVQLKKTLVARQCQHREQVRSVQGLQSPPPLQDVDPLYRLTRQLSAAASVANFAQLILASLGRLREVPVVNETTPLKSLIAKLVMTTNRHLQIEAVDLTLRKLIGPPAIEPVTELSKLVTDMNQVRTTFAEYSRSVRSLNAMLPPPEPMACDAIKVTLSKLVVLAKQVADATKLASQQRNDLATCEAEIRQFVAANPKCSTCGARIDPEAVISIVPSFHEHASKEVQS